jgi:hypothetical protein
MSLSRELKEFIEHSTNSLVQQVGDALLLEQLLSDKLYRALVISTKPAVSDGDQKIIDEALTFYETSRFIEVLPE